MPLNNCFVQDALDWSCWPLEKKAFKKRYKKDQTLLQTNGVCVCVLIMPGQFMFVACFFFAQKCNLIVSIVLSVCHILRPSFSVPFQSTSDAYRSWVMEWFASHLFAWGHSVTRRGLFNNFRGDSCAKKKHMGKCNRADLQTSLCQDLL